MLFEISDYKSFKRAMQEFCDFLVGENVPSERVFDSKLAVHELLANVLQHSGGSAKLYAELSGELLLLSLRAEKAFAFPQSTDLPELLSERGRGLYLVDSVVERRTVTSDGEIIFYIRIK